MRHQPERRSSVTRLSGAELDCLRRVADGPSVATPPCPDEVLKHLLDLKLVYYEPRLWAPLEAVDVTYHLTASGAELLKRLNEGSEPNSGQENK